MLVGKSLMTIEGIGKMLDPDLDVFGEASPYFFELLKARYSPQRIGNELWRGMEQLSRAGYDMPMQVREVLEDLRLGRLALRTPDPGVPRAADRLGRRIFSGLVVLSLVGSGTMLVNTAEHTTLGIVMLVLAGLVWIGHAATRPAARSEGALVVRLFAGAPGSPPHGSAGIGASAPVTGSKWEIDVMSWFMKIERAPRAERCGDTRVGSPVESVHVEDVVVEAGVGVGELPLPGRLRRGGDGDEDERVMEIVLLGQSRRTRVGAERRPAMKLADERRPCRADGDRPRDDEERREHVAPPSNFCARASSSTIDAAIHAQITDATET